MHLKRLRPGPATLARLVLTLALVASSARGARADVVTLDRLSAPIVRIAIRAGDVTIRTWDRPSVAVEGDPSLSIVRHTMHQGDDGDTVLIPRAGAPPTAADRPGAASLPAESFVVSTIAPGPHEVVVIRSTRGTRRGPVIVTVPNDSIFVFAAARNGNLDARDLRAGTFVGFTGHGRLSLENLGGTVFAQTGRGRLDVSDSTLERMRARSLFGNVVFERCRMRQIEVTSVAGSIVYDNGSFDPGLAHFESTRGNVAIGTQGAAELGGRAMGDGRVFTNFERGARVTNEGGDARAIVGGGGPVVTATSQSGNIYLYDGTLHTRDRLQNWQAPIAAIERRPFRRTEPHAPERAAPERLQTPHGVHPPRQQMRERRRT